MADATIAATDRGAYELALLPGEVTRINVAPTPNLDGGYVTITVHTADAPVYFTTGNKQPTPRASDAEMIPPGLYVETQVGGNRNNHLNLVCATTATVSVSRA